MTGKHYNCPMENTKPQPSASAQIENPNQLLYALMITAIILPLSEWMLSVSLPIIRDDFGIAADSAAWISTAFTLPFMMLMPVYGRISDSLSRRRLLIMGICIFTVGSLLATFSTSLASLMIARVIQGVGVAGLLPLSLALITGVFPPAQRSQAMGLWSTVGPVLGIISPILAGLIVATWSWRASFIPGTLIAFVSILAIFWMTPATTRQVQYKFLKSFDWIGVVLLSATLISLLFYFSSRPITGRPALQDWRLFLGTVLFLALFIRHENRKTNPFINLQIFKNRALVTGSVSAGLRMLTLGGGLGFLMPLYLADVIQLDPTRSGFYLMVNPVAMTLFVRYGGRLSDRFGSRMIGIVGFGMITAVMLIFSQLPSNAAHWLIVLLLFLFGTGTGLMLAMLHQASLDTVPTADLGTASGIYSMIRFLGAACGSAFGGVLLQFYLDQSGTTQVAAYQHVFLWFAGFAILGLLISTFLPQTTP